MDGNQGAAAPFWSYAQQQQQQQQQQPQSGQRPMNGSGPSIYGSNGQHIPDLYGHHYGMTQQQQQQQQQPLDPSDFPALGASTTPSTSTTTSHAAGADQHTISYASTAGSNQQQQQQQQRLYNSNSGRSRLDVQDLMFYENGRQKQQQPPPHLDPAAAAATGSQDGFNFDDFPALGGAAAGSDGNRYAQGMVPQRRPLQGTVPPLSQQQQQSIDLNQNALLKHRNTLLGVMTGDSGGGGTSASTAGSSYPIFVSPSAPHNE